MPEAVFWPLPPPSAAVEIPVEFFQGAKVLGDLNAKFKAALKKAGYVDGGRYYSIPNGFAIVAQIEHINQDGSPLPGSKRWQAKPLPPAFTFKNLLRVLFDAKPGFYRIIVFAITNEPIVPEGTPPSQEAAGGWLNHGMVALPAAIARLPYTEDYACVALIYEFERRGYNDATHAVTTGAPPAYTQLVKADLWSALEH